MDQNPRRHDRFELYQGIANLAPNGAPDGGLCVLRGSHLLHEEHFAHQGGFSPEQDSGEHENGYNFTREDADWFRSRGCEETKVCAGEGDLILWDSRLVHWNASPVGAQVRFATYVCYCPRGLMGAAGLKRKLEVFRERKCTTHFPVSCHPSLCNPAFLFLPPPLTPPANPPGGRGQGQARSVFFSSLFFFPFSFFFFSFIGC
jgi:hypothetical protein